MKRLSIVFTSILLVTTITTLFVNGVSGYRLKRALFDSSSVSSSNQPQSIATSFASAGQQPPFPWFGLPSPPQPVYPFPSFPSADMGDQIRQRVQDYISAVTKQIQDQSTVVGATMVNCTPSETKSEIIEMNGRKFNRTVTTCITSGSGSVGTSVSSSTIPLDNQP